MTLENTMQQFIEEIKLFVQYAVPKDEIQTAFALIDRYSDNGLVMRLFREYYSSLPEAREEAVIRLAKLMDRQGVHLFVVSTAPASYLYAASVDHILLLGEYRQEVASEVLSFFGFKSQEDFLKLCPPAEELDEYAAEEGNEKKFCPACGVSEGEYHLLGCTVEICPWCTGQLSYCNCRFLQLKTDKIDDEQQLETFAKLLTAKGRIPYQECQAPAYPGTSGGLDDDRATE